MLAVPFLYSICALFFNQGFFPGRFSINEMLEKHYRKNTFCSNAKEYISFEEVISHIVFVMCIKVHEQVFKNFFLDFTHLNLFQSECL